MISSMEPYKVLQVSPEAEPEVIRAAYRVLARKHHPDIGGSTARMTLIDAAWSTLGDPEERARYDRQRRSAALGQADAVRPTSAGGAAARPPAAPGPGATPNPGPIRSRAQASQRPTVLDFGRYAGTALSEIAARDPDYLEWLARTPTGQRLRSEIATAIAAAQLSAAAHLSLKSRLSGRV